MFAPREIADLRPAPDLSAGKALPTPRTRVHDMAWSEVVRAALGAELRRMRTRAGLSQVKAGELMGATSSDIRKHENARRGMTADTLIRYVHVYGGTLDELDGALARALEPAP